VKVGDLVGIAGSIERLGGLTAPRFTGIITCIDPEELGDKEEVEVTWLTGFTDVSNHSTWNLEVISASR